MMCEICAANDGSCSVAVCDGEDLRVKTVLGLRESSNLFSWVAGASSVPSAIDKDAILLASTMKVFASSYFVGNLVEELVTDTRRTLQAFAKCRATCSTMLGVKKGATREKTLPRPGSAQSSV